MAEQEFDIDDLLAPYDRGRLVPFIGSGMSMPSCVSWKVFVERLEKEAKLDAEIEKVNQVGLIPRAHQAIGKIRMHSKEEFAKIVERSLWDKKSVPKKTVTLAETHWPIVCTTNYEDLYCQAVAKAERQPPVVIGRSARDCRRLLEQMAFPDGEVLWALQGFIGSTDPDLRRKLYSGNPELDTLRKQLVVGHSEYRAVTHRLPHFRRAFAHLYRARSLLFLGSGLAEPYFLGLFDEVVELTGPPEQPHYALLPEGSVDAVFLRSQYHILVRTYPCEEKEQHEVEVQRFLGDLSERIKSKRSRVSTWGFRTDLPDRLKRSHSMPNFEVVSAGLPHPEDVDEHDAVAISCGRGGIADPGEPLISEAFKRKYRSQDAQWLDPYVVVWHDKHDKLRALGIVARELIAEQKPNIRSSRDRRSPLAIAEAFRAFLKIAADRGYETVHVQLLAAGPQRVFLPWVSLAHMARAFGDWTREPGAKPMRARVYVVDPGVRALLRAGQLDLSRELEGAPLQITVEVVGKQGDTERYFLIANRTDSLSSLAKHIGVKGSPVVSSRPSFHVRMIEQSQSLYDVGEEALEAHLLSGSTLTLRFGGPG
jgi:hypothetical protein